MVSITMPLLALLTVSAAMAGCAGDSNAAVTGSELVASELDSPAEDRMARPAAPKEPEPSAEPTTGQDARAQPETRQQTVYTFSGMVVGASAPVPDRAGTLNQVPPAKQDNFTAPAGTVALDVEVQGLGRGVGLGRVKITGPDGSLVYSSITGIGDGAGGGCSGLLGCSVFSVNQSGPGTYVVSYYVAGAFDLDVHVAARIAEPPGTKPQVGPVVFAGHIVAPEPGMYEIGYCGGLVANSYQFAKPLRDGMWNVFSLDGVYDGWTYAFNVDGLVAGFGNSSARPSGTVPAGAVGVTVCSKTAIGIDYELALTPPGPVVFNGHIYAPDAGLYRVGGCHGVHSSNDPDQKFVRPRFDLLPLYGGWSFALNVDGVVADFHGDSLVVDSAGTVPEGAHEVYVCSPAGVDIDFQLMLTPPV